MKIPNAYDFFEVIVGQCIGHHKEKSLKKRKATIYLALTLFMKPFIKWDPFVTALVCCTIAVEKSKEDLLKINLFCQNFK